jgi:hypothetical protein
VSGGAGDRTSFVRGVREARRRYKGPFSGAHVCALLSEEGYVVANDGDEEAFRLYRKDGCKTVPVNESWTGIYDDDPIFNCLRRDLDLTRGKLRTRLNQIRGN